VSLVAPTLQSFFTDRLVKQRRASPRTIASYRDSLRLLVVFVHGRSAKTPCTLDWDDLDAETISAFLDYLEAERHNSPRTRNLRLTAIRSLFTYASLRHPEHAALIQRVLAIPAKRFDKPMVSFLAGPEVDSLVAAPDPARWEGRRDRALMLLAVQTGLRLSELTGLDCGDVSLGTGASVGCEGKGRKHRAVPGISGYVTFPRSGRQAHPYTYCPQLLCSAPGRASVTDITHRSAVGANQPERFRLA
jgi:site-specific recombinase XerD